MKVLLVGYGGGHVAMLLPVMAALRGDGHAVGPHPNLPPEGEGAFLPSPSGAGPGWGPAAIDCTLMALTTGKARADAAGIASVGYRDFLHLVDAPRALAWGERLIAANSSPDVSRDESLAYLGINYLDLVEQLGEQGAAAHYAQHGRFGFVPRHFMRRVIEHIRPDVVVATNSPRSEQAAIEGAVALGIPSAALVDLFAQDADPFVHRLPRADLTCVLAESVRQRLVQRGFAPERVAVTGNPSFDGLFAPAQQEAARRLRATRGWNGKRVILWAGQMEPDEAPGRPRTAFAVEAEGVLRAMVAADPSLALIVRYHPGEWQHYPRLPAQDRVHFSEPNREPPQPLLLASDAVVVQNSTLGLEAAIAGRPVVSLEHSESVRRSFSLAGQGVSTGCDRFDDLPRLVREALAGRLPAQGAYASDGRAAQRVAAQVLRMAADRAG